MVGGGVVVVEVVVVVVVVPVGVVVVVVVVTTTAVPGCGPIGRRALVVLRGERDEARVLTRAGCRASGVRPVVRCDTGLYGCLGRRATVGAPRRWRLPAWLACTGLGVMTGAPTSAAAAAASTDSLQWSWQLGGLPTQWS